VSLSLQGKFSLFDQYVASLALDAVSLVRLKSGLKTQLVEKLHVECTASSHAQPWLSAVAELEKLLMKSQRGLPITVVLSNQFVRYNIIPAMPPLTASDKITTVATQCFRETYGDIVDDWLIRVNPLPDGDTLIANAVDAALVLALETLSKKYACKLKSIQPYLMSGFNSIRRQVNTQASCYVQVEAGRIYIALARDGAWQTIVGSGVGPDWSQSLASLITREMLLAGWNDVQPTVYFSGLCNPKDLQIAESFIKNVSWKTVQATNKAIAGYSATNDQLYAMAMSAVSVGG
jgi:hypothetical protein